MLVSSVELQDLKNPLKNNTKDCLGFSFVSHVSGLRSGQVVGTNLGPEVNYAQQLEPLTEMLCLVRKQDRFPLPLPVAVSTNQITDGGVMELSGGM